MDSIPDLGLKEMKLIKGEFIENVITPTLPEELGK
jgi:hypothetical protein